MNSIGRHYNFNDIYYDEDTCRKISVAIKKSRMFAHIDPMNLLKEKLGLNDQEEGNYDIAPPNKIIKIQNPRKLGSPIKAIPVCNVTLLPTPKPIENSAESNLSPVIPLVDSTENSDMEISTPERETSDNTLIEQTISEKAFTEKTVFDVYVETPKSPIIVSNTMLPSPESLFEDISPNVKEGLNKSNSNMLSGENPTIFNEEYLKTKNVILEKFADVNKNKVNDIKNAGFPEKTVRNDKFREKQNKNLFSLATFLLPIPSQLYDKDSLISALISNDTSGFIDSFKEAIKIEDQISSNDLCEIIDTIVKENLLVILPEFCNCLEFSSCYSEALSNSFVKHNNIIKSYQENILNCLLTMMDPEIHTTITSFINACLCVNEWNKMWTSVLIKMPMYKFEDKYFNACMSIFQNLNNNNSFIISHDTMLIIINYIMRHYCENYEMYMADIWLYCVLTTDINSDTDLKVPQKILEKVIEKLTVMKNPSFLFIMKLLSKNWMLLCNNMFCVWLAQLISDKSDVKQCLLSLKESIDIENENVTELQNSFLFLSLHVMSLLNKRGSFTCSKKVYDALFQNKVDLLNSLILTRVDRFKFKWIVVDCLISSADYQNAFQILKDFDVLKDLEKSFAEYNSVKSMLPNLLRNLLSTSIVLTSIIDLFEQLVSIFLFNEPNDSSYTKNYGDLFNLIAVKVFEYKDKDTVKKMIVLLDHILSADIEFDVSKESMRYLLVASVRADLPFNELLDFIDQCFKSDVFPSIETTEDGFGSFISIDSSLTTEEVVILISWLCRHAKIKLVQLAQSEGASVRGNLMKVCNLKFILNACKTSDNFAPKVGCSNSLKDLLSKFTESLSSPKYLSHPIKFSTIDDTQDTVTIVCESRVVYNAIYYSDI